MTLTADREERLDAFLVRMLPEHSRTKLAKLIKEEKVTVEGSAAKPSQLVQPGQEVLVQEVPKAEPHDLTPADIPLDIRYEDEHLLVVNKPRGLASHPAASLKEPSLVNALLARGSALSGAAGDFRPGIVHRLDKETTGLMLVAKTDPVHVKLARQIEKKETERRYLAVVAGRETRERFTIEAPIARDKRNRLKMTVDPHGKPAVTHIKVLNAQEHRTLVIAKLETGRTHQIRVHLLAVGHPVLGDPIYAPKSMRDCPLQLHAAFLAFTHPVTQERIEIYAEPPPDFLMPAESGDITTF